MSFSRTVQDGPGLFLNFPELIQTYVVQTCEFPDMPTAQAPFTSFSVSPPLPRQDGQRSEQVMEDAKKAKADLKLGKPGGPYLYTTQHAQVLEAHGVRLNKREKEALNLNFGSLVAT